MNYLIVLFTLWPLVSTLAAEQRLNLAETEVHSTAGIANSAPSKSDQSYANQLPDDGYDEDDEEDSAYDELAPPTTIKKLSPTRSKTISRTTSRPSSNNSQSVGVGIAPVVVPVYDDSQGYNPPPPGVYNQPPAMRR